MGTGGIAFDSMMKTLRNNSRLLRKIRVFPRIRDYNHALEGRKVDIRKQATPRQLATIRARTIARNKRQTQRQAWRVGLVLAVIVALLALLVGSLMTLTLT